MINVGIGVFQFVDLLKAAMVKADGVMTVHELETVKRDELF